MMTDAQLSLGYYERFKRPLDQKNLDALKSFMRNFEVEDYVDFNEMYNAIQASVRDVYEDVEKCSTFEEKKEVLRRRYTKL